MTDMVFTGACDVSAAVRSGPFVVAATDEDNVLRWYLPSGGAPLHSYDLGPHLGAKKEADIEAAATAADGVTYWIGSHGTDSKGNVEKARRKLFGTRFAGTDASPQVAVVGVCNELIDALTALPGLDLESAAKIPPKTAGGLAIEGLVARGGELLIGFRNPIVDGRALVVPLENAPEAIAGSHSRLGTPMLLDLGGRGIRALEPYAGGILILAGAFDAASNFALYGWDGTPVSAPRPLLLPDLGTLAPEEILADPTVPRRYLLFSDDGEVKIGDVKCKDLPEAQRRFRALAFGQV